MSGSEVVIVGGGVTGLSAGWWLARSGVKVTVLDKFIVGWEASGRNGGGASHYSSPLFDEEQRLWPQMDDLLGYPTEHQKERILIAMTERQWEQYRFVAERHKRLDHPVELLDVEYLDRMVKPPVPFGDEAILLPLPLGHRNQDAFLLMFGRIAQQVVHLRPEALLFIEQRSEERRVGKEC